MCLVFSCGQSNTEQFSYEIERARSLSPSKNSQPATSPNSLNQFSYGSSPAHAAQPQVDLPPSPQPHPTQDTANSEAMNVPTPKDSPKPAPSSPTKSSARSSINATVLSRTGTLSWQQRPSSRDSNTPRSRPLSRHADEIASATGVEKEEGPTKDQIAQSLSSKDPSWFRQTADRGLVSSAYRKSREDSQSVDAQNLRQLPGMSREPTINPEKAPYQSSTDRSRSPSLASSAPDTSSWGNRFSSVSSQSTLGGHKSPLPAKSSQRFDPPAENLDTNKPGENRVALSSSQAQLSRERPSSPTKGLGGFVQSAMMKRSDSFNKRWSAQATPGLSRGNSVASYRGGIGHSVPSVESPGSPPRDTSVPSRGPASSPSAKSRPTSSHNTSTVLHQAQSTAQSSSSSALPSDITPALSHPSLDKVVNADKDDPNKLENELRSSNVLTGESLPISPTKTMDPKRWSPTKASWLESALARPESPKLTSPKPQTPSWMADLQRSKLGKEDSESVKSPASNFTVVSPAGLMRSPPLGGHARPLSIGGLPEGFTSGLARPKSPEKSRDVIEEEIQSPQPSLLAETSPSLTTPSQRSFDDAEMETASTSVEKSEMPIPAPKLDEKGPPSPKPKPRTPPKTDLRANLRPRQNVSKESTSTEPEFRNVFGKLKRTETRNYVAPDKLKDNILRGKAALNLTSGPQTTRRVDDFKESILKKKESMKAEVSLPRENSASSGRNDAAPQKSPTIPEAITKRKNLGKRTTSSEASTSGIARQPNLATSLSVSPEAVNKSPLQVADPPRPSNEVKCRSGLEMEMMAEINTSKSSKQNSPSNELETSSGASETAVPAEEEKPANLPVPAGKTPASASDIIKHRNEHRPVNKLASRLHPNLAGILSRGPVSTSSSSRNASSEDSGSIRTTESRLVAQEAEDPSVGSLTHITKGRAKGPKRRLPNASPAADRSEDSLSQSKQVNTLHGASQMSASKEPSEDAIFNSDEIQTTIVTSRSVADLIHNNENASTPSAKTDRITASQSSDSKIEVTKVELSSNPTVKEKTKPIVAAKSPDLRKVSSPPSSKSGAEAAKIDQQPLTLRKQILETESASTRKERGKSSKLDGGSSQNRDTNQRKLPAPTSSTLPPISTASPRRDLPKPQFHKEGNLTSDFSSKPTLSGLGLKLDSGKTRPPSSQLTPPPEDKSSKALDSLETPLQAQVEDAKIQKPGPFQQPGQGVTALLQDFFREKANITEKAEIDAQTMILNRPSAEAKSRVLKLQIWQINADGKKEDLPPQQEHILYEDCMYLCVHSFEKPSGFRSTEVYLWIGDGVSEAAIEDAQLFCRKEARDNSVKLELLKQGREPAKFFQALGGILITRRSRTSSLYMLCGRRHLGHIAFDEVDLDAASLCSGFPYIISAKFGKLYLWKGKGSGADEVGCARLIGMDLGLTGEIEEVAEGEESLSFFESFGVNTKPQILSQQWSLRSKSEQFACRLFRVELEQSKSMAGFWTRRGSSPAKISKAHVQEIHPFCQKDLDSRSVFVLDAYFKIFV
jgi:Domain of unknown function (DUF4045)